MPPGVAAGTQAIGVDQPVQSMCGQFALASIAARDHNKVLLVQVNRGRRMAMGARVANPQLQF